MDWWQFLFVLVMIPSTVRSHHIIRRRHHSNNLNTFHDMQGVPDLESVLPKGYLAKHKNDFHRFHVSTGGLDIRDIKNPYLNNKEPVAQYLEMGSMKNLRKAHLNNYKSPNYKDRRNDGISLRGITFRKSNDVDLAKKYRRRLHKSRKSFEDKLAKALYQKAHPRKSTSNVYFSHFPPFRKSNMNGLEYRPQKNSLPELTEEQLDHPGNSLFFIKDKRFLGAHHFPKKEPTHSVYGNLETLGLNVRPTSEEVKLKAIEKILKDTPIDAQEKPFRLYNPNHPGLNLLFGKKMPLDAAKFSKAKTYLVYGNLDNLDEKYRGSDRYARSNIRRFFKRHDSGRKKLRQNIRMNINSNEKKSYFMMGPHQKKKKKHEEGVGKNIFSFKNKPNKNRLNPAKMYDNKEDSEMKEKFNEKTKHKKQYHEEIKKLKDYRDVKNLREKDEEIIQKEDEEQHSSKPEEDEKQGKSKQNKTADHLVYGNMENDMLGIRYDNTPYRVKYSGFRKNSPKRKHKYYYDDVKERSHEKEGEDISDMDGVHRDEINDLGVIFLLQDNNNNDRKIYIVDSMRRTSKDPRLKYMSYESKEKRNETLCNMTSSSSSSDSIEQKNPGNPYTLFKGHYRQNWLWNHHMDGDHMNVNPYGPKFDSLGPTGNELFMGRKWWYFNQDDYKPFRRRK